MISPGQNLRGGTTTNCGVEPVTGHPVRREFARGFRPCWRRPGRFRPATLFYSPGSECDGEISRLHKLVLQVCSCGKTVFRVSTPARAPGWRQNQDLSWL